MNCNIYNQHSVKIISGNCTCERSCANLEICKDNFLKLYFYFSNRYEMFKKRPCLKKVNFVEKLTEEP